MLKSLNRILKNKITYLFSLCDKAPPSLPWTLLSSCWYASDTWKLSILAGLSNPLRLDAISSIFHNPLRFNLSDTVWSSLWSASLDPWPPQALPWQFPAEFLGISSCSYTSGIWLWTHRSNRLPSRACWLSQFATDWGFPRWSRYSYHWYWATRCYPPLNLLLICHWSWASFANMFWGHLLMTYCCCTSHMRGSDWRRGLIARPSAVLFTFQA